MPSTNKHNGHGPANAKSTATATIETKKHSDHGGSNGNTGKVSSKGWGRNFLGLLSHDFLM